MEFRAGRHEVDVINGLPAEAYQIQQIGALDPYDSPERKYFSEVHKDKKGYFTPLFVVPVVLGYNTKKGGWQAMSQSNSISKLLESKWLVGSKNKKWTIKKIISNTTTMPIMEVLSA